MIADTSGLLALFNRAEPRHAEVADIVMGVDGPLVVSPFVVAELDYLIATRLGVEAEIQVLQELSSGAYVLESLDADELARAAEVVRRYADLGIGVADASLVVLADRHRTRQILTLDRRHFDTLRPLSGGHFSVSP